ncbi:hypothetical protein WH297_01720 [Ochrobactrum vermis]|uniref:Uncharacterized protein n=1 Tax=Ochrobactrum vermis TaxID=1827297 RepID=A0ABU8P9Z1_9HYPH|nr:hypothetical protein [Ochrobactrum vermis]PQZ29040.1 hypothetical protein CQZ93_01750 [Ochrobactrum vermis]
MLNRKTSIIRNLAAVALLGSALVPANALAQENGRFRLEGTETGYVRLDTRTGVISTCTEQQGQLVCKMATEDREAYENDIADLQDRVKKLEDKVSALEGKGGSAASGLPSEQEFEQSMSYMERFMRRFMDIAKSFDSEPESLNDGAAPGGRT